MAISLKILQPFVCFKSAVFLSSYISCFQLLFSFQVYFNFRLAYRRSSDFCDQTTINQGTLLSAGSWTAQCTNPTNPHCSSSVTVGSADYRCTDYSTSEDWTMGENNFTYTFSSASDIWTVRYVLLCGDNLYHSVTIFQPFRIVIANLTLRVNIYFIDFPHE